MGVVVQFNYILWVKRFPEFAYIDEDLVNLYFHEATLYVRNDGGGPVNNPDTQLQFLNLVTAHIAKLYAANPDGSPSGATTLVGRISDATEGSVHIGAQFTDNTAAAAWFNQTEYGASFWAASRAYRTMRYLPPRNRRVMNPWRWRFHHKPFQIFDNKLMRGNK